MSPETFLTAFVTHDHSLVDASPVIAPCAVEPQRYAPRVALERHNVGVCLLDNTGAVIECDAEFCNVINLLAPEAVHGRKLRDLVPELQELPKHTAVRCSLERRGKPVELALRPTNTDAGLVAFVGNAQQLGSESHLLRQLRVAHQTLNSIIEASPLPILTLDDDKHVVMWNRAAEQTFGWTRDEIIGQPYPLVPRDELPLFNDLFERVVINGRGFKDVDSIRLRKDGTRIELRMHTAPMHDEEGRVIGGMALLEDLTERRQLEDQVRHNQKMEAIGRLAGGIAHDFNNMLTVVIGMADLLALDPGLSPDSHDFVAEILRASDSAGELVGKLMTFSRRSAIKPEVVDINRHLKQSSRMLQGLVDENIEFVISPDNTRMWVRLDRAHFDQALVNLVVNAADAMPDGGRLSIHTTTCERPSKENRRLDVPERFVRIEVRDTGFGIPKDILPQIFEPFFTTKGPGSGTGLGLANVYGIVHQHNGHVEVDSETETESESESDHGTVFHLFFPLTSRPELPPEAQKKARAVPTGSERVLLVEDNPSVRISMLRMLSRLGYEVETATDGVEALELLGTGLIIDLVLTDLSMPRLDGAGLARELERQAPQLPVVFMSGHLDDPHLREQVAEGTVAFLQKPVSLRKVAQTIRERLDCAPAAPG